VAQKRIKIKTNPKISKRVVGVANGKGSESESGLGLGLGLGLGKGSHPLSANTKGNARKPILKGMSKGMPKLENQYKIPYRETIVGVNGRGNSKVRGDDKGRGEYEMRLSKRIKREGHRLDL
jgi:hypothetical protein